MSWTPGRTRLPLSLGSGSGLGSLVHIILGFRVEVDDSRIPFSLRLLWHLGGRSPSKNADQVFCEHIYKSNSFLVVLALQVGRGGGGEEGFGFKVWECKNRLGMRATLINSSSQQATRNLKPCM